MYLPAAGAVAPVSVRGPAAAALNPRGPVSLAKLVSERDFQELATTMRQASSPEVREKQRALEAELAVIPEAERGVRVEDLTCDLDACIGRIVGVRQEDIDSFMSTAARSTHDVIYNVQQFVVPDSPEPLRRFAIAIDPNISALPLPADVLSELPVYAEPYDAE